jgi:hypothetical protein
VAAVLGQELTADRTASASFPQDRAELELRREIWRMSLLAAVLGSWTGSIITWALLTITGWGGR